MMKHLANTLLAASATLALAGGCTAGGSQSPAAELFSRLKATAENGQILYAHQDDLVYGHSWTVADPLGDDLGRSDVAQVCGSKPAMVGFDLGGIEQGNPCNLDGVSFELMRRAAVKHTREGGVVTFSWHPRNPLTGGDSWDISQGGVVASVLDGGENHAKFMDWLRSAADFLDSLRDSSGVRIPAVFRPWHENIGSWFWWGGNFCTADEYKALYRLTRDYIENDRGLDNLLWAYSPNSEIDSLAYFSRYPGDRYVDILGVDHYEYIDASAPDREKAMQEADAHYVEVLFRDLRYMENYAAANGKLTALTETGFESIPNPRWWTDVLLRSLEGCSPCYVLTWRNDSDKPQHFYAPFPGSADAENFREFAALEEIVLLGDEARSEKECAPKDMDL